jgi:predicted  nucleic acid-binding Zn-ribbon protein
MTVVIRNMTLVMDDIDDTKSNIEKLEMSIAVLNGNVSQTISSISENEFKLDLIQSNMTNIKVNLVGLGDYINNVNGDLSQLLFSFDGYSKEMVSEMSLVFGNISKISDEMSDSRSVSVEIKKHLDSVEFVTTTIRSDVAGLTTKIYNVKTSLFEMSNEMSTLKATQTHMQSAVDKMEMKITDKSEEDKSIGSHMEDMKSDIFAMRTGLASLTNTVFTMKSQIELRGSMDSVITDLKANVSLVRSEFVHFTREFSNIKPGNICNLFSVRRYGRCKKSGGKVIEDR